MRNRDQLHKCYYQSRNPTDWLNYRNARTQLKSAGPDKINMRIIRDSPYILTRLTNIINNYLSSNIY